MPIYEYVCEQDGSVIELLRPMADADKPVEDPDGRGRTFRRRQSTFLMTASGERSGREVPVGTCCPCGRRDGPCAGGP